MKTTTLPEHPGVVLRRLLKGRSQAEIADTLGVTRQYLNNVLAGRKAITLQFGARLAGAGLKSVGYWATLQSNYDEATK